MAVFEQLRDFLEHDMSNILGMAHGGNYTATLVLAVGAEALSLLIDADENEIGARLLTGNGVDRQMALDVLNALRGGIGHTFETKYIKVGEEQLIEMVVSWGEQPHLTFRPAPLGLYINVRTMWDGLRRELETVEAWLKDDPVWAGQTPKSWRWIREVRKASRSGWESLIRPYREGASE